jgi:hypothetical protein
MGADFSQIAPQAGGTLVSGAMQAYGALSQGRTARECNDFSHNDIVICTFF